MCRNCYTTKYIPCRSGFGGAQIPRTCESLENGQSTRKPRLDKCPMDPFIIIPDKCKFVDHQTLKLQEDPETIPTGEMPRSILLSVERSIVSIAVPGTRVSVLGIYTILQSHAKKSIGGVAIHQPYMRVIGLKTEGSGRFHPKFTPEEESNFIKFSRQPQVYKKLVDSISPAIFGHDDIKRAILCQLFGGSKKVLPDGMRLRGDINILLLGDPGTAKSQMLKFVEKVSPIGVYTSGKGSSAAGLTASIVKDKSTVFYFLFFLFIYFK
jgi:DNA replication licensing factor MCM5